MAAGHMSVNRGKGSNPLDSVVDANDHMFHFMNSCMVLDGSMNNNGISFLS